MKANSLFVIISCLILLSAGELHAQGPSDANPFYGGGIGFVGSFEFLPISDWPQDVIALSNIPNYQGGDATGTGVYANHLGIVGFNNNTMITYGGQGFGQITEHVRLSGTALFGSKSVSGFDATTQQTRSVTVKIVKSVLNVEYLWQLNRNIQIGLGAGGGVGRITYSILQRSNDLTWERLWMPFGGSNFTPGPPELGFRSAMVSAIYLIGQPIASLKWQLSSWIGVRLTGGLQIAGMGADAWKLNGQHTIAGAESMSLLTPFFRGMLYFGI
ncbi:MAG: hypothetical protein K9N46_00765 [Candidatus Marinimicrobia bacterium]|nr:hypothetical protein [Candidatus Neomarinimicrobiota bacterium]MCF7827992.1 hypothetical protein [Candidatus Neomarinimicrobiota bacterium]MCF7879253.1 hypothetical protein [Candidatus Neomarinimicrobiota bacterium]